MRFSLCFEIQMVDTSRDSEIRTFHEAVEQALLAEKMGFDCIWAVEHHCLSQYAHMSSPESFLAFIAGKTDRIDIGHGVVCLPFAMNHPIKVAERIATLDILSKGRLHFGVGKGGTQQEAGAFGQQIEALEPQIDESMYMIPKMWLDGNFEHKSDLITIPPRPIWPKPYQQPHPLMYLACTRNESLVRAGSRGMGAMVLGFNTPEDIAKQNAIYRQAFRDRDPAKQVGFRPNEKLLAGCPAIVLDDRETAARIGLRGQRFFAECIHHWYGGGPAPVVEDLDSEGHRRKMQANKDMMVAYLGEAKIPVTDAATMMYNPENCYGTVADAIDYMERMKAAGTDEVLFMMQMGTVPHEASLETIRNIGKHVIPRWR